MEDLIKKLIAVDEEARKQVEESEKARADVLSHLEQEREKIIAQAQQSYDSAIKEEKLKQQQKMDSAFSEESLKARNKKIIDELDQKFEKNVSNWVDTIVKNVVD